MGRGHASPGAGSPRDRAASAARRAGGRSADCPRAVRSGGHSRAGRRRAPRTSRANREGPRRHLPRRTRALRRMRLRLQEARSSRAARQMPGVPERAYRPAAFRDARAIAKVRNRCMTAAGRPARRLLRLHPVREIPVIVAGAGHEAPQVSQRELALRCPPAPPSGSSTLRDVPSLDTPPQAARTQPNVSTTPALTLPIRACDARCVPPVRG